MGDEMSEGYIGYCCMFVIGGYVGGGVVLMEVFFDVGMEGWWCCVLWWEFLVFCLVVFVCLGGFLGYGVEEINFDYCEESVGF